MANNHILQICIDGKLIAASVNSALEAVAETLNGIPRFTEHDGSLWVRSEDMDKIAQILMKGI
jgi:hypothetical protein